MAAKMIAFVLFAVAMVSVYADQNQLSECNENTSMDMSHVKPKSQADMDAVNNPNTRYYVTYQAGSNVLNNGAKCAHATMQKNGDQPITMNQHYTTASGEKKSMTGTSQKMPGQNDENKQQMTVTMADGTQKTYNGYTLMHDDGMHAVYMCNPTTGHKMVMVFQFSTEDAVKNMAKEKTKAAMEANHMNELNMGELMEVPQTADCEYQN